MKKEKNIIKVQRYESPCGLLLLGSFGDKLCLCDWQVEKHHEHVDRRLKRILYAEFEEGTSDVIEKAILQLDEYFIGRRKMFDVPLLFVGTDFQKTVWNELLNIPFGTTVKWPGESECRRLSVLLPMPTAQMRCQSLYPVIVSLAATVL